MGFKVFFDAGKILPSINPDPTLSSSDVNESLFGDVWTENLCCIERIGSSSCLAKGFLNPSVTSLRDLVERWRGFSATKHRAQ